MVAVDILLETPEAYFVKGIIMVPQGMPSIKLAVMPKMEVGSYYPADEMGTQISYKVKEYPIERFRHKLCIVTKDREHAEKLCRY